MLQAIILESNINKIHTNTKVMARLGTSKLIHRTGPEISW